MNGINDWNVSSQCPMMNSSTGYMAKLMSNRNIITTRSHSIRRVVGVCALLSAGITSHLLRTRRAVARSRSSDTAGDGSFGHDS